MSLHDNQITLTKISLALSARRNNHPPTATAEMARLNPITYLTAYLDTCGRTGGKPPTGPNLERFLPWTATREDLDTWAQPPRPG